MTRPEIELADTVGRRALVRFLSEFPGESRDAASWTRRLADFWEHNPVGGPRGWVLLDGDRVVGFRGLIPQRFRVDGRDVVGVGGTTWRILPSHQGSAVSLLLQHRGLRLEGPLLATTPAPHVEPIIERLGYQRLSPTGMRRITMIPMAPLAGHPIASRLGRWCSRLFPEVVGGWRVCAPEKVGFDRLWAATADLARFTRTRDALSMGWFVRDRHLLVRGPAENPTAFAVFGADTVRGHPALRMLDYWPPPRTGGSLRALVRRLLLDPFGGAYAMTLMHHPNTAFDEALRSSPVPSRPTPGPAMYCLSLGHPPPETGRYFTLGEGDNLR